MHALLLSVQAWDLIDPENRIKRDVAAHGPAAAVTSGNAFARYAIWQLCVLCVCGVGEREKAECKYVYICVCVCVHRQACNMPCLPLVRPLAALAAVPLLPRRCCTCRHSLRLASKHKVQALLAFPDDEGESHDGVVAWAAHRNIRLVRLASQVCWCGRWGAMDGTEKWWHTSLCACCAHLHTGIRPCTDVRDAWGRNTMRCCRTPLPNPNTSGDDRA